MACGACGGDHTTVWELRVVGKQVEEHPTQHDANLSREHNHAGRGLIIRVRRPVTTG